MLKSHKKPNATVLRTLDIIEWAGLLIITIATIVAIGQEIRQMLVVQKVLLEDILLLFIFLEILTMVGLYFKSGKLPLRYPIYIAMVAIARYIIIGMKQIDGWTVLAFAGAGRRHSLWSRAPALRRRLVARLSLLNLVWKCVLPWPCETGESNVSGRDLPFTLTVL